MEWDGTDRMDRRGCLTRAIVGLAALSVPTLTIRSCIKSCQRETYEAYADVQNELTRIAEWHYPGSAAAAKVSAAPIDARSALSCADKALACFGDLLQVEHPYLYRHPFINSFDVAKVNCDSWLKAEDVADYQSAGRLCLGLRQSLPPILMASRTKLQEAQRRGDFDRDPMALQLASRLIPRLEILAARMRGGTLMTGGNVLQWTNKFGTFQELIGQAEHYNEARAEIRALSECLGSTAPKARGLQVE